MKNKKLTSSQSKRSRQVHEMKEYLITTFSDSICVCASLRQIDGSITGDRVKYTLITEFDECYSRSRGARYHIREKWFSMQYYEENSKFLEQHFMKMKERINQLPGPRTTTTEPHKQNLLEITNLEDKPSDFIES